MYIFILHTKSFRDLLNLTDMIAEKKDEEEEKEK